MYTLDPRYDYIKPDLIVIDEKISYKHEISRYIRSSRGKPILFKNVVLPSGDLSRYPVIANLAGSREIIARYLGVEVDRLAYYMMDAYKSPSKPRVTAPDEYIILEPNLDILPIAEHYPGEAGRYITASIVIAEDPEYGLNASYHRMLQLSRDKLVARVVPRHLHLYIERGVKDVAICIGNTPEILVAAAMSPPLGVSEMDIANSLKPIKLVDFDGVIGAPSEIVLVGRFTGERHREGPFVDVTGTYDIVRMEPVIKVEKMYIKENAFYHDILPADQEHKILMGYSRVPSILDALLDVGIDVKDIYLTPGGASWLHCIIKIRKTSEDDPKKAIDAAFKAHRSLKMVIVVDEDIDIYDWESVEWALATRVQPDRDVYIYRNVKGSSLDPSADQVTRLTSKWGIDATIPDPSRKRDFMRVV